MYNWIDKNGFEVKTENKKMDSLLYPHPASTSNLSQSNYLMLVSLHGSVLVAVAGVVGNLLSRSVYVLFDLWSK